MKNFLNALYEFTLGICPPRAPAALARAGMYKEAQTLMAIK